MTSLSIRLFNEAWADGIEYALWDAINNGPGDIHGHHIDASDIDQLERLANRCHGWWFFNDLSGDVRFVSLGVWRSHLNEF